MDILAYFLPGFHRDKFNDSWWGEGFTEWMNVENSCSLFEGHIQPNRPLSGYYDLTEKGVLENSYSLAKNNGIDAFILYDYWYEGQRPLGSIVDLIHENKEIDFRYSLCWANHSWTRSWKNRKGALDVLIEQRYSNRDELSEQINYYVKSFSDERYFRVNGRPLFQIYKPNDIPNLDEFCDLLREASVKQQLCEPLLVGHYNGYPNPSKILRSMDALVVSNPTTAMFCDETVGKRNLPKVRHFPESIKNMLYVLHDILPDKTEFFEYEKLIQKMLAQSRSLYDQFDSRIYFSSFCGFDNTPRYKKRAKITNGISASLLKKSLMDLHAINPNSELIFINAWNEWGEGMMLEPSEHHGDSLLSGVKSFSQHLNS